MLRAIVGMTKKWLIESGYAGLYNQDKGCSCSVDDLLCCSGSVGGECVVAEEVACDCKEKCKFHLRPADGEESPTAH